MERQRNMVECARWVILMLVVVEMLGQLAYDVRRENEWSRYLTVVATLMFTTAWVGLLWVARALP